jgi:signal transduction histidine kinase/CheY-like chemotaxis protein
VNLVLTSPVPIVMLWGPEGIMIYNDAYSVFAGGRHPRLLGSPVLEGWPEVADFNRRVMDIGLKGGTLSFKDEHLVLHRHGAPEDVWADLNYSPILDETQTPAGVFAIVVETTGRVLAERRRRDAEASLRELNATLEQRVEERTNALRAAEAHIRQQQKMEAVGKLTGGVAHDFNNLLQAMSACLQMVGKRTKEPSIENLLSAGQQAVDRGAKLVQQLMAFSRQQSLNPTSFDVRDHLVNKAGLLERALREDVRRKTDYAPDLWPIEADPTQFELAILNLTVNASDAMPAGGTIILGADNVSFGDRGPDGLKGDFVRIWVADTGTGMTADVLSHACDPFFTTKAVGRGSGLGLSQVYGFCRQSGGTMLIDSTPGEGTVVTLILPRSTHAAKAEPNDPQRAYSATPGARVLVVEDEPLVAGAVTAALRDLGYAVAHASSGDEAVERLQDGEPVDVLFTDVIMPGRISGLDLAREAQRILPGLPVVLATGYSEKAAKTTDMNVTVLAKPYRIENLVAAIESALYREQTASRATPTP